MEIPAWSGLTRLCLSAVVEVRLVRESGRGAEKVRRAVVFEATARWVWGRS